MGCEVHAVRFLGSLIYAASPSRSAHLSAELLPQLRRAFDTWMPGLASGWSKLGASLSIALLLLVALYLLRRWQTRVFRERQTLKQTQEVFHFVLDSVKDYAIFLLDPGGRVISWNAGAQKIFGYEPAEILGSHLSRLYPEASAQRGDPELALRHAADQGRFEVEGWRVRKGSSRLWASVVLTGVRDTDGQLKGFVKITRDMSERKRAEEELRHREELMNSFFAASPAGLAILNLEFRFQKVNGMLCSMTGQTLEGCLGKNISEVLGEIAVPVRDWLQEVAVSRRPLLNLELLWSGADPESGPRHWVTSYFPVLTEDGRLLQIGAMLLDITERKQAEEALRESEDTLRRLSGQLIKMQDEERRRIARELHDSVGQCLAAIKMNLETMAPPLSTESATAGPLSESVALADQCLNDIRTISYLLHPPLLDRLGLPSALRCYVDGFAQRSGIQVQLEIPPDFMRPPAEFETALFRIVQEGLTNVHRHSGSPTVDIRLAVDAECLSLELSDQGRGIPREKLRRFNGTRTVPGVGIAGMRERVRQLGGRLELESSPSGTTVRVLLPVESPQLEVVHDVAYPDCR